MIARLKHGIRLHSRLREIVGKELKAENKPAICQSEQSKITVGRVFQSIGHADQLMHLNIAGEELMTEGDCS